MRCRRPKKARASAGIESSSRLPPSTGTAGLLRAPVERSKGAREATTPPATYREQVRRSSGGRVASCPRFHTDHVFTLNARIHSLRPCGDRGCLAHDGACAIQQVDAKVFDDEARLLGEVRLVCVHVVRCPERQLAEERVAYAAVVDRFQHCFERALVPPILVDHELNPSIVARRHHHFGISDAWRKRFLADHVQVLRSRCYDEIQVRIHLGGYVHEIDAQRALVRHQRSGIFVPLLFWDAKHVANLAV